jgi:hypothetical protein
MLKHGDGFYCQPFQRKNARPDFQIRCDRAHLFLASSLLERVHIGQPATPSLSSGSRLVPLASKTNLIYSDGTTTDPEQNFSEVALA